MGSLFLGKAILCSDVQCEPIIKERILDFTLLTC